jgi:hypothetical protein
MILNETPTQQHIIVASSTDLATGVADVENAAQVLIIHEMSGTTPSGYATVQMSPDGVTWVPVPSSLGTQPSGAATSSYEYLIGPTARFLQVTLHETAGVHDVWVVS